jgi:hypothetical protein
MALHVDGDAWVRRHAFDGCPHQLFLDVIVCTELQIRSTLVLPQCEHVTLADDDSDIGRTISKVF